MRGIAIVLAGVLLAGVRLSAQQPAADGRAAAEADLRSLMDQQRAANVNGDLARVSEYMAEDYAQTDIYGNVQDKQTWIRDYFQPLAVLIKAGKFRWDTYEVSDVRMAIRGDCAVVTGRLELKGSGARPGPDRRWVEDATASFQGKVVFTRVYMQRNGKWMLVALHNAVPQPATAP